MRLSILIVSLLLSHVTALTEKEARFTPVGEKITLTPAKYHKQTRDTKHTSSHTEELYAPTNELGGIRYKRQSNDMTVEDNHTYYLSTFYPSESGVLNQLWVDLTLNTSHHVLLSDSYLMYLTIPFELPFYGHLLDQVAITTAGLCNLTEMYVICHSVHSHTQLIHSLMRAATSRIPSPNLYSVKVVYHSYQKRIC